MTNQTTSKEAFLHEPILHSPNANATTTVSSFPVFLLKLRDLMTSWPNTRSKPVTRLDHAGEWLIFLHIQIHIKFWGFCATSSSSANNATTWNKQWKKSHPETKKENHLNFPRLHLSLAFHFTCFSGEQIYLLGVKFDKASSNFCHSKIDSWRYSSQEKECNIGLLLSCCLTFPGLGFDTMGGLLCYYGLPSLLSPRCLETAHISSTLASACTTCIAKNTELAGQELERYGYNLYMKEIL